MVSLSQISAKDSEIQSIYGRLRSIQSDISERQHQVSQANSAIASSVQRIAELYVPGFTTSAIKSVPEEFQRTVVSFYDQKQSRIEQLDELLDVSARHVTDLQRRELEAATSLNQGLDRRTEIEKRYDQTLATHEEYQAARAARAGLRLDAANAAEELKRRTARREEFQAPYLADPFFSYFLARETHIPRKDRTLVQKIDTALARAYGFNQRLAKFDMFDAELWEAERRVADIATRIKTADEPVRDIEARVATELGLIAARDNVESLTEAHKQAGEALSRATQDQIRYRDERRSLDEERGTHYQRAVDAVIRDLTGRSIDDLVELAASTPSPTDDALIEEIRAQQGMIRGLNEALVGLRDTERSISSELSGVQRERDALKSRYDDEQEEIERQRREEQRRRDEARRAREREEEESRRSSYDYSSSSSSSFGGGGSSFGGGFGGGGSSVGGSF